MESIPVNTEARFAQRPGSGMIAGIRAESEAWSCKPAARPVQHPSISASLTARGRRNLWGNFRNLL
jgi:hypothetical protein